MDILSLPVKPGPKSTDYTRPKEAVEPRPLPTAKRHDRHQKDAPPSAADPSHTPERTEQRQKPGPAAQTAAEGSSIADKSAARKPQGETRNFAEAVDQIAPNPQASSPEADQKSAASRLLPQTAVVPQEVTLEGANTGIEKAALSKISAPQNLEGDPVWPSAKAVAQPDEAMAKLDAPNPGHAGQIAMSAQSALADSTAHQDLTSARISATAPTEPVGQMVTTDPQSKTAPGSASGAALVLGEGGEGLGQANSAPSLPETTPTTAQTAAAGTAMAAPAIAQQMTGLQKTNLSEPVQAAEQPIAQRHLTQTDPRDTMPPPAEPTRAPSPAQFTAQSQQQPPIAPPTIAQAALKNALSSVNDTEALQSIAEDPGLRIGTTSERMSIAPGAAQAALARAPASAPQITQQITSALLKQSNDSISIRLDPPELGRLTLRIAQIDGAATAHITAERHDVVDLLRRHESLLARELHDSGFQNLNFSFTQQDQNPQGNDKSAPRFVQKAQMLLSGANAAYRDAAPHPIGIDDALDLKL